MKRVMQFLGILMAVAGVVGFVLFTEMKKLNAVDGTPVEGGLGAFSREFSLEGNHSYTLSFWIEGEIGESMPGSATAVGDVTCQLADNDLATKTLSATSSNNSGGVKRAQTGFDLDVDVEADAPLLVTGTLTEGDSWELSIYRDLPPILNLAPGLSIILAIIGAVIALKNRK